MRRLGSFFLTIFVCLVIICSVTISLDLIGIVNLPEKYSLKKYLSKSIGVLGAGEEVYYPDYNATGLNAENKIAQDINNSITTGKENNIGKNNIKQNNINENKVVEEAIKINKDELNNSFNNNNVIKEKPAEVVTPDYNVTDNSFFYTQLDTYGKTFYSRLYSNLDNLKTGTYTVEFGSTFNELLHKSDGEQILTDAFQLSINALLLDHPEIFYLDVTKMYMFTESTTTFAGTNYKISIGPDGDNSYLLSSFRSLQDVYLAEEKIKNELSTIISKVNGNVYEKILQVHNYLVDNIQYDSEGFNPEMSHTLYGALVSKIAVCDGYAKAFKYILDNLGISCVEVCGTAQNSSGTIESHAWNDVLLNGKWYAVDVTWDDPIIIGNGKITNDLKYTYFLNGSNTFYNTHVEDGFIVSNGEFKYPEISFTSYK